MTKYVLKALGILTGSILLLVIALFTAMSVAYSPAYAWRVLTMLQSDTGDINRFPHRTIANGPTASALPVEYASIPVTVTYSYKGAARSENLQKLIERTNTSAFIVIRADKIIMQTYPKGEDNLPNTSFSILKDKETEMNTRTEGSIAIIAALIVLFSAMWDARISVAISVVALAALGVYRFVQAKK